MNRLLVLFTLIIYGCSQPATEEKVTKEPIEKNEAKTLNLPSIGEKIQGNFDGKNPLIIAKVIKVKTGQGNPVEGGTADGYEIQFSDTTLKAITAGCCEIRLINEGDLNNDGTDEFSVFQAPMNGCTYTMITYSLVDGNWKQIVAPFLIPTGCERMSDAALLVRVFSAKGKIYYLSTDVNDESGKLIETEAKVEID